jgi:hypothetical protein
MLWSRSPGALALQKLAIFEGDYEGELEFREHPATEPGFWHQPDRHALIAHHPDHGEVGTAVFTRHGGDHPTHLSDINIKTSDGHERKGVASSLMHELESRHQGVPIDHGSRSFDGMRWAHSFYGTPRYKLSEEHPDDYPGGWTLDHKVISHDQAQAEIKRRGMQATGSTAPDFYHASDDEYEPGDVIDPSEPHDRNHRESSPHHVCFTDSVGSASPWGEHIYRVKPAYHDGYEPDPRFPHGIMNDETNRADSKSYQSRWPLHVVEKIPRPEHLPY